MSDMLSIEICKYNESLAEDIAQMWNTWDDLWPGGFTQGIPFTADRVKKQYGKMSALALLIAIDSSTKKPVGSCTLHPHWRDKEAAYVGTLGVSPEVLGKKVGKQLLLESIRIASEKGYTRIDLGTWPGNMRAVPLYKKVGMMWDSEGQGLNMYDYIPGILKHPLCAGFFNLLIGVHDWYDVHIRNLTQAPDDFTWQGMVIYPYDFKLGNSSLLVNVDKYARGITAVDCALEGKRLRVEASVNSHEVVYGLSYTYSFEIENETAESINVKINLHEFQGLVFDADKEKRLIIKSGEKAEWNVPFHLTSATPLFRDSIKTPSIITEVDINGQVSFLKTGMKVRSPAEIRTRGGEYRLSAGSSSTIPITIISNLRQLSIAHITVRKTSENLRIKVTQESVKLEPSKQSGTMLEISSTKDLTEGTHDIWLSLALDISNGFTVVTREICIPIFCLGKRDVAVSEDDHSLECVIVSPYYTARFAREGAILTVDGWHSEISQAMVLSSEIGPPFGLNPFRFAERKASISQSDTGIVVSMSAKHSDRPLIVEDRAIFEFGTGVIKHEQWVENVSSESQIFQGRLIGRGGGMSIAKGQSYVPFSTGIVSEPLGNFLFSYPVIPSEPSTYSEGWVAIQNESSVQAQMWRLDNVEEIRINSGQLSALGFPAVTLAPKERLKVTDSWLVFSARSWEDVQRLWQTRVALQTKDKFSLLKEDTPQPLLSMSSEPAILPRISEAHSKIRLHSPFRVQHGGVLEVIPPKGWNAVLQSKSRLLDGLHTDVDFARDSSFDLTLVPSSQIKDEFAIHRGQCRLRMEYDMNQPFYIVQLGGADNSVDVSTKQIQGCRVHIVRNGCIEFAVSEDYGGCLFSLKNNRGVEFLTSSFPKATPRVGAAFDNYHGGVQPIIFDEEMDESLGKARTNNEKMSARNYSRGFWSGVEIRWEGKIQKTSRGVKFNLRYMTAPGCPIVMIEWKISNRMTAPVVFVPTILIDPKLDEELREGIIHTKWSGKMYNIQGGHVPMLVTPTENIVWIQPKKGSKRTTGVSYMVHGSDASMFSAYLGDMIVLAGIDSSTAIMPGKEHVFTSALFIDPPDMEVLKHTKELLRSLMHR